MKKLLTIILTCCMVLSVSAGCKSKVDLPDEVPGGNETPNPENLTLRVVADFKEDMSEFAPFEAARKAWERETGHTVNLDGSISENADVLYYYNDTRSAELIKAGDVVSVEQIREEFPGYAGEHELALIPLSHVDNKAYAIPMYGHWELLYVNTKVLAECGVEVPNEYTTWEQFLAMCEAVKNAGYVPIAAAIEATPNHLFEYAVFNYAGSEHHRKLPESVSDTAGMHWTAGLGEVRRLYEADYFHENTRTMSHGDAFELLLENKAAFAIDGSWRLNELELAAEEHKDFTVTFVPGTEERPTTHIIAGLTHGWYITRKAWDDPGLRTAAVSFVQSMISKETLATYNAHGLAMTLTGGTIAHEEPSQLRQAANNVLAKATGITPPVREQLSEDRHEAFFGEFGNIVTGRTEASEHIHRVFVNEE